MARRRKAPPLQFHHVLANADCCRELGRAILAAGMLETVLRSYLHAASPVRNTERRSLGWLVNLARQHNLLGELQLSLDLLVKQRNSLAHRVHAVLTGALYDELLPETDLIESDVSLFEERAWQLANNLGEVARLVAKRHSDLLGRRTEHLDLDPITARGAHLRRGRKRDSHATPAAPSENLRGR